MANPYTGTTFSGIYKDDYNDSDGYHKILFNSGRHIQGRELNQLQTILQRQVSRMASNIFMDVHQKQEHLVSGSKYHMFSTRQVLINQLCMVVIFLQTKKVFLLKFRRTPQSLLKANR